MEKREVSLIKADVPYSSVTSISRGVMDSEPKGLEGVKPIMVGSGAEINNAAIAQAGKVMEKCVVGFDSYRGKAKSFTGEKIFSLEASVQKNNHAVLHYSKKWEFLKDSLETAFAYRMQSPNTFGEPLFVCVGSEGFSNICTVNPNDVIKLDKERHKDTCFKCGLSSVVYIVEPNKVGFKSYKQLNKFINKLYKRGYVVNVVYFK